MVLCGSAFLEDPVEEVDSSRLVGDPVEAGEGGDEGVGASLARAEGLRIVSRDQEKWGDDQNQGNEVMIKIKEMG